MRVFSRQRLYLLMNMATKSFLKCVICGRRKSSIPKLFLAALPLDPVRCQQWVQAIGDQDLVHLPIEKLHQLKFVCGMHFDAEDFNKNGNRLLKSAVPKLNLLQPPLPQELFVDFPQKIGCQRAQFPRDVSRSSGNVGGVCELSYSNIPGVDKAPVDLKESVVQSCSLLEITDDKEHNPPQHGDQIGYDDGVADDVVVFADEDYQVIEEVITEETILQSLDHIAYEVTLSTSTIDQTTSNPCNQVTRASVPNATNKLDFGTQIQRGGQQHLHSSGNSPYPSASSLKKLPTKHTDKEMETKHILLTRKYSRLCRSHELMKKKCKKSNMFETLTANMNPVAKEFFRTQVFAKRVLSGNRFSPEVKILALSIMKLSSECYKLLQKIFLIPSKKTLNSLYQSIAGKDIKDVDNFGTSKREMLNQLDTILLNTTDDVDQLNQSDTQLHKGGIVHNTSEDELNQTDAKLHKTDDESSPTDTKTHMTEDEFKQSDSMEHINENNFDESDKLMRQQKFKPYDRQINVVNRKFSGVGITSFVDTVGDEPQTFKRRHKPKFERQPAGMLKILRKKSESVNTTTREPVVNTRNRKDIQIGVLESRKRHSTQDKVLRLGLQLGSVPCQKSRNLHFSDSANVFTSWQNPDSPCTSFSADSEVSGGSGIQISEVKLRGTSLRYSTDTRPCMPEI